MPSPFVDKFTKKAFVGKALDLGCGQGRNALFLAKQGFSVVGVDKKEASIAFLRDKAKSLDIELFNRNLLDFPIRKEEYDLILGMNVFNMVSKREFEAVVEKIKKGLKKGGIFILSMHNNMDPLYEEIKKECKTKDGQTFWNEKGNKWYFPEPGGLKRLFDDFLIIFYKQIVINDPGHPNKPEPHAHSVERLVVKK